MHTPIHESYQGTFESKRATFKFSLDRSVSMCIIIFHTVCTDRLCTLSWFWLLSWLIESWMLDEWICSTNCNLSTGNWAWLLHSTPYVGYWLLENYASFQNIYGSTQHKIHRIPNSGLTLFSCLLYAYMYISRTDQNQKEPKPALFLLR